MPSLWITAAALAAGQAEPPSSPLQPLAKWTVEYNDADCIMSRSFGTAASPVTFAFQPSPTGSLGQVALLLPANGQKGVRRGEGAVTLHPSGQRFEARYAIGPLSDGQRGARFDAEQEFWDALPGATALTMEMGGEESFSIALGRMTGPLSAIKTCTDDLIRSWGAEPGAIARWPKYARIGAYFSSDSYPRDAIRAGAQGRTVALVTVDRSGEPVTCRTVRSAGHPSLDARVCEILIKRRFEPAADGPERRFAVLPVRWRLPR